MALKIGGTTVVDDTRAVTNVTSGTFSSTVSGSSFSGAGTGLTGSATGLSIGGSAGSATNILNGAANQIPYQTGASATSFIAAPGVADTYLSFNGTSFAWATVAAGGGGGGDFNTGINNAIATTVPTTLTSFVAPTANRNIIRSIHVTNIGLVDASFTTDISGAAYSGGISLATNVPVPVGSAVEILKQPKVMALGDVIRIMASVANTLHVTVVYETSADTKYFGKGIDVTATATDTLLHTATANSVIQSILLSNDDATFLNDAQVTVKWTNAADALQGYYSFNIIVPAQGTVELMDQPKYLASGFKVFVSVNQGNRVEATIAGKTV